MENKTTDKTIVRTKAWRRKKLFGALVCLVAASATSIGAVYAWFALSKAAQTQAPDFSLRSDTASLYVSLDNTEFSPSVDLSAVFAPILFTDLTWDASEQQIEDKLGTPVLFTDSPAATNYYYEKVAHFRSNKPGNLLFVLAGEVGGVATTSYVTPSTLANPATDLPYALAWRNFSAAEMLDYGYAGGALSAGDPLVTRGAYCVRVKFESVQQAKEAPLVPVASKTTIWEPNDSAGFGLGTKNIAHDYYSAFLGRPNEPAWGVNYSAITNADIGASGVRIATLELNDTTYFYEVDVKITIWVEGHDNDCFKTILTDRFAVSFCFTTDSLE